MYIYIYTVRICRMLSGMSHKFVDKSALAFCRPEYAEYSGMQNIYIYICMQNIYIPKNVYCTALTYYFNSILEFVCLGYTSCTNLCCRGIQVYQLKIVR